MAKNFGECARDGGKVVTKKLKNGQAVKVCYDSDGKTHYKNNNKNKNKNKPKKFGPATPDSISNLAEYFKQRSNN